MFDGALSFARVIESPQFVGALVGLCAVAVLIVVKELIDE